jgi:N-acetylmuramoyl-L-alanine amidase
MKLGPIRLCPTLLSLPTPKGPRYLPATMNRASLALLAVAIVGQACHRGAVPPTGTGPAPAPRPNAPPGAPGPMQALPFAHLPSTLPPVPLVEGPLVPRVVYPQWNQMIASKDSNFITGSVGNGRARLTVNGHDVAVWPNGAFLGWIPNPPPTAAQLVLVARLGADSSATYTHQVRVAGMTPPPPDTIKLPTITDTIPTWIILRDTSLSLSDTDRVVIGRPAPNTTFRWFFFPNTRVQLTGRYPNYARVRLDSGLEVWVEAQDAKVFATDTMPPRRVIGNLRVRPAADWVDIQFPMAERPAYLVEERERGLDITLYGSRGNSDVVSYPTSDTLVRHVEWTQELNDRARYRVELSANPFGYLVLYENGMLTLRIRRLPSARMFGRSSPSALAGLTIAVDAGHPPAGATGPTGLYEADAALPVGAALKRILEERGAEVVMTRTTRDAVDLQMRPVIARRGGAHAFVSLHYNAYPDGVNPFNRPNGIEVYFYRPHSEQLARAVQSELIAKQQLEDQGVHFRSLAVVRSTWFPAVLAEGGFMLVPEQENAMRTEQWQERYARAVADGLEKYFRVLRGR